MWLRAEILVLKPTGAFSVLVWRSSQAKSLAGVTFSLLNAQKCRFSYFRGIFLCFSLFLAVKLYIAVKVGFRKSCRWKRNDKYQVSAKRCRLASITNCLSKLLAIQKSDLVSNPNQILIVCVLRPPINPYISSIFGSRARSWLVGVMTPLMEKWGVGGWWLKTCFSCLDRYLGRPPQLSVQSPF